MGLGGRKEKLNTENNYLRQHSKTLGSDGAPEAQYNDSGVNGDIVLFPTT